MSDLQMKKKALQALIESRRVQSDHSFDEKNDQNTKMVPVAIIGMSGLFPQSENKEKFWQFLSQGESLIRPMPDTEYRSACQEEVDIYGGFLPDIAGFDADFFKVLKGEAELMDPQLRKLIMCVFHAFEDAGYAPESFRGSNTGVFIGFEENEYGQLLEEQHIDTGNGLYQSASMIANYISWLFDLHGPSDVINAMCAGGAVAIHHAVAALRRGEITQAVVGAANIMLKPETFHQLRDSGQLTSADCVNSFGQNADGYLRGEGVSSILLKPLDKAIADGDSIYAVIRHSTVGFNGRGGTSIAAPDVAAHAALMKKCWLEAGIRARDLRYIEAQGMGNPVADIAEWDAFNHALSSLSAEQNDRLDDHHCAVSTLKPITGHMHANAAMGALFKIVHSLRTQTLFPIVGLDTLNPHLKTENRPCHLLKTVRSWPTDGPLRLAAIHAWGSGGNQAHLLIEEYAPQTEQQQDTLAIPADAESHFLPFSAPDVARLRLVIEQTKQQLASRTDVSLQDIAYTLQCGRSRQKERIVFVCKSREQWLGQVQAWLDMKTTERFPEGIFVSGHTATHECPDDVRNWLDSEDVHWLSQPAVQDSFFASRPRGKRLHLPTTPLVEQPLWLPGESFVSPADGAHSIHRSLSDFPAHIAEAVTEVLCGYLGIEKQTLNLWSAFSELGFDSMMVNHVSAKLKREYQLDIAASTLFACRTPMELIECLSQPDISKGRKIIRGRDRRYREDDIAVIGIAGRYPQADDLDALWQRLAAGESAISEVPEDRWCMDDFYCENKKEAGLKQASYGKWGAFLDHLHGFDATFFNLSPREATFMHPKERMFMQTAWHTLEDAGYTPESLTSQKVGVFVGVSKAGLDSYSDSFFSIANRVSYKFNFTGLSMPVDTACSSSLTAVHEACLHLRSGECDIALVGGVNAYTHPSTFIAFSELQVLSETGKCAAFGAEANGFVPGEGVGAVLLKSLAAARRDGDQIHAIIRGSSVNHGGRANGYTVPNPRAQQQLIADAIIRARVSAQDISYVEAHGTGTELGDPIELDGLSGAFIQCGGRELPCALGSLKPNIGHLEAAAGIAGLTKVILQMRHRQLVPSLHSSVLNPKIDFTRGPFHVVQALTPWETEAGLPRIATVSSFGAGGSNAHVIVAEDESSAHHSAAVLLPEHLDHPVLFLLSARTASALKSYAQRYLDFLGRHLVNLTDLAYTQQIGRQMMEYRLAIVVPSRQELTDSLTRFCTGQSDQYSYVGNIDAGVSATAQFFMKKAEAMQLLVNLFQQHELSWLAELWVEGAEIDWTVLNRESGGRRISLPVYPFEMEFFAPASTVWPQNDELSFRKSAVVEAAAPVGGESYTIQSYTACWRAVPVSGPKNISFDYHVCISVGVDIPLTCDQRISLPLKRSESLNLYDSQAILSLIQQVIQTIQTLIQDRAHCRTRLQLVCSMSGYGFGDMLVGALRTAAQEWTYLSVQLIELYEPLAEDISAHLFSDATRSSAQHIRYLQGQREVCYWHPQALSSDVRIPESLSTQGRSDGGYIITGGLGSIGQGLTEQLFRYMPQCKIYLVGRSQPDAKQLLWLEQWRIQGAQLTYYQGDVAAGEDVSGLKQRLIDDGCALNGIFHCAGVIHDALISRKTPEEVARVCAAKVTGTLLLDQVFAETQLDFFVCFSSASSVAGRQGQADYAMANGFMDALMRERSHQVADGKRYGCSLSLNWGLWQSEGMSLPVSVIRQLWETSGMQPISLEQGFRAIMQAIASVRETSSEASSRMLIQGNADRLSAHLTQLGVIAADEPDELNTDMWLKHQLAVLLDVPVDDLNTSLTLAEMGMTQSEFGQLLSAIHQQWENSPITLLMLIECTNLSQLEHLLTESRPQECLQTEPVLSIEAIYPLLTAALAQVTGLIESRIDVQVRLERYGLDSITITRLNDILETKLGPLPATLFYEYQTLRDVAQYLLEQHHDQLSQSLSIADSAPVNDYESNGFDNDAFESNCSFENNDSGESSHGYSGENREPLNAEDIAIIGLAGHYPQAETLGDFWRILSEGKDCITEIPAQRWDHTQYFSPQRHLAGKTYARHGGFMDDVDKFDPLFFNISPKEAQHIEPQERLFLQCSYEAIQDAGYTTEALNRYRDQRARVGVFVGVTFQEYQLHGYEQTLKGNPMVLSMSSASIANRVSWFGDFHGPSIAIDTMCASSLSSIHLACQSILTGESHVAIAGGVNVSIHPAKYLMLGYGGFASEKGHCHSFGADGDGYIPGEGVGAVVLKSLSQAEQDGDHIYAVIKASTVNHGGRTHGYSVPNPQAQSTLVYEALGKAGLSADAIGYIEAHGTGTPLGDPIEVRALDQAFHQAGRRDSKCSLGSVKSNIGHCESAAGIAGLTKVLLQMKHRQLVPSLHTEKLNPNIDFSRSIFQVQTELAPWTPVAGYDRLVAGISSFGAGGANAHLIVTEHSVGDESESVPLGEWPIPFSARTPEQLVQTVQRFSQWLEVNQPTESQLNHIVRTLQTGREAMACRLGLVVHSVADLKHQLVAWLDGTVCAGMSQKNDVEAISSAQSISSAQLILSPAVIIHEWVEGRWNDWGSLYPGRHFRRVSLPCYPFEKRRCWFHLAESSTVHPAPQYQVAASSDVLPYTLDEHGKILLADPASVRNLEDASSNVIPLRHTEQNTEAPSFPKAVNKESDTGHPVVTETSPSVSDAGTSVLGTAAVADSKSDMEYETLRDDLSAFLQDSLARALYLSPEEISNTRQFTELGLDSIIGVEWIREINQHFNLSLPVNVVYQSPCLAELTHVIARMLRQTLPGREAEEVVPDTVAFQHSAQSDDVSAQEDETTLALLKDSLAKALYLSPEEISPTSRFSDLGLDSIISVEWIRDVNRTFALSLPADIVYQSTCLRDMARCVREKQISATQVYSATVKPDIAVEADVTVERNASAEQHQHIAEQLKTSLAKALYLDVEEISLSSKFTDLGLDSIIGVEWIREVNRHFNVNLAANDVYRYPSLNQFSSYLSRQCEFEASSLSIDQILLMVRQGTLEPEDGEALLKNASVSS